MYIHGIIGIENLKSNLTKPASEVEPVRLRSLYAWAGYINVINL